MFEVSVEAKEFAGLSRVKQHRLVTESLKDEIAEMHGIRIHTTPPTSSE
ncbi:BolA-like protein 3 [Papilio machaon]|uniref:BolA-like protein 3 n=2 Tax=Papilio machaon TaxID=76193 RepID=A0A0N1II87_PAPMA|nr:BolA-like protein 3 [Papilio machaon]